MLSDMSEASTFSGILIFELDW